MKFFHQERRITIVVANSSYTGIYPTLKEFILVDTETVNIEAFRINDSGYWELEEYKKPDTVLLIKTVGVAIPIEEIYEGIKWPAT